jgi:hypothetical protein
MLLTYYSLLAVPKRASVGANKKRNKSWRTSRRIHAAVASALASGFPCTLCFLRDQDVSKKLPMRNMRQRRNRYAQNREFDADQERQLSTMP